MSNSSIVLLRCLLLLFLCLQAAEAKPRLVPAGAQGSASPLLQLTEQEKAWLVQHPVIRVSGEANWPPFEFIGQNGDWQGIGVDFLRLAMQRLGIQARMELDKPWSEKLQMLERGELDMAGSMARSKERERFLNFTGSYAENPVVIVTRRKGEALTRVEQLNGHTVAVEKDYVIEDLIRQLYPKIRILEAKDTSAALNAVSTEQADAYLGNRAAAIFAMERDQLLNLKIAAVTNDFPTIEHHFGIRKDWPELAGLMQKALDSITIEERMQIQRRWLGAEIAPDAETQSKELDLTPQDKAWLEQHPVIDIGVDGNWPPVDFVGQLGRHKGILHDYLQLLEQRLGIAFKVHPGPTFEQMLKDVRSGKLNVGATIVETEERSRDLAFSKPYFAASKVIITRKESSGIHSLEDLDGKSLAIEKGFFTVDLIRREHPEIRLHLFDNSLQALKAVSWGQADAYVGNQAVSHWLIQQEQLANLKIAASAGFPPSLQRFAVRRDSDWMPLVEILNKALSSITLKQQQTILSRWIGKTGLAENQLKLSLQEQEWLEKHPTIRIGVDPAWPPIEYVDKHGKYQGLASEYLNTLFDRLGIQYTLVPGLSWDQVLAAAQQKEIDLLPAATSTKEREQYLLFTEPYLDFPSVIFTRNATPFISGLEDLVGKRIAMEKGYASTRRLQADFPNLQLHLVDNTHEALKLLSLGKVDAYVGDLIVGGYLINQEGLTNLKVAAPTPYNFSSSFAVRKDWPELRSLLQKALHTLSEADRAEIRKKWLTVRYDVGVDYTTLWQVVAVAGGILLFGLIWLVQMRRQKLRIQASEAQLQRILDAIPLSIVVTARDGRILLANPHVAMDMEVEQGDAIDRNIAGFYADEGERTRVLEELRHKGQVKDRPVRFRSVKGSIIEGLLSVIPVRMEGENAHLGMLVNLTERFRMERELAEAKETAEESSHFKSRFLANMSHEIRTPMNAIIGMSYLALQSSLTPKQRDYIEKIELSAHNLLGIVNDILDFSRIEAGKLSIEEVEFQLDEVLQHLADLVSVQAQEKGIEFLFQRDMRVPDQLIGDPLRIGQILLNLVQNAIKFTEQGEVVVAVELLERDDPKVEIGFTVRDTGIGIEPDKLTRLFDAFVQRDSSSSRKYGGTGLGLSISKQLVELMHGEIDAQSSPGEGSEFRFRLPLAVAPAIDRRFDPDPDLRNMPVLVVDDNPVAQEILGGMLHSFSFDVTLASSAREAYAELQTEKAKPFELVIMDWQMPEVNGIEAARHILQQLHLQKRPRIILVTAYGREEILHQAEQLGLDGYLVKPISPSTLFDTIISTFHGKADEGPATRSRPRPQHRLKGKVLLVEDNPINQQVARELLESFGLLVSIADDGAQALRQLDLTDYDLVLMDIQMPDMDGFETTQRIRAQGRFEKLPIIAMTAHAMQGDRERCLAAGMHDYLSKPIDPEQLHQLLKHWLGGKALSLREAGSVQSEGAPELPPNLQHTDTAWGLQRVGGNRKLYLKLLGDFYHRYHDSCRRLREHLAQESLVEARRLAHTVQGVAGNLGTRQLQQAAKALEEAIRSQAREQLPQLLEAYCTQAGVVFAELAELAEPNREQPPAQDAPQAATSVSQPATGLVELCNRIAEQLRNGEPDAAAQLGELERAAAQDPQARQGLSLLAQQIRDYDFDAALQELYRIARLLNVPMTEGKTDD